MSSQPSPPAGSCFQRLFSHASGAGPHSPKGLADETAFVPLLAQPIEAPASASPVSDAADCPGEESPLETQADDGCETLLQEAHDQAQRIVDAATLQAQEIAAQARQEARETVRRVSAETAAEVKAQQEAIFRSEIVQFRQRFDQAQEEALEALAHEVMSLVADIAEKVIYRAVESDPEATLRAVKQALGEQSGGGRIRVIVPSEDAAKISEQHAALTALLREAGDIQIVSEDSIRRGGCVIQTDRGESDARLETRLATVREEIDKVVS